MQKPDTLIRTKFRLPFTRSDLVPRARLQDKIASGIRAPLTLVVAPAGFGKTTLLTSCIADLNIPVAWISLDKDDNLPGRFLTYLIAALQQVDEHIGIDASQLMEGLQPASDEAIMTSLINDLDGMDHEIVLVLDDYQLITNVAVHSSMAFLFDHFPSTLHLVFATRSDPPLPLARLRARGQTVELRASDLRFSIEEATRFLNEVMGLHLDLDSIAALEGRTEGWIAGLQMAALSMRDRKDVRGFIEGFSGTNRYILDYLLEEVLASQPADIQHFLLCTSILERFSASLCDFVLSGDDISSPTERSLDKPSAKILDSLDKENLFLISLDEERNWYRYHHLFSDLLQARLQEFGVNRIRQLHGKASIWLEENGYINEAVRHLFISDEFERAAILIEKYGPERWGQSDLSVIQMADELPSSVLNQHLKIVIYQVWLLIMHGSIEKVIPLINLILEQISGGDNQTGSRWIRTVAGLAARFLGIPIQIDGFTPLPDERLMDEIPPDELVMRDAAEILYGMTLGRMNEIKKATEFSLKSMENEKARHPELLIPSLVPFLATMYVFQGRLHAAYSLCKEFLEPINAKGIRISSAGNLDVVMGNVYYEWNKLDNAENHLRAALKANEPWGNIMTDAFGMLSLVHVLIARGDRTEGLQVIEKFENRLPAPFRPHEFNEPYKTLRVHLQLAFGDIQSAAKWADHLRISDDFKTHPEDYQLELARIRLAQKRYSEVEELLGIMQSVPSTGNRIVREIEINMIKAVVASGQNFKSDALKLIETSLILAEPEEHIRVFINGGDPVRELLVEILKIDDLKTKKFCSKVLEGFSSSKQAISHAQVSGMVEQLSDRELEVLQCIERGKTNLEIAEELIVASGTVKAHTANIFRKLDVANRTEAVSRARELGILT